MRVTDQSSLAQALRQLQLSQERVQQSQQQAASGQRVERPSDDPAAWGRIQAQSEQLSRMDTYNNNIAVTRSRLQSADSTLQSMQQVLTRFREVTQMSISLVRDPASVATEAGQLRDEVLSLTNTAVGGEYLFSGYSAGPPQAGGRFVGDNQKRAVEVSPLGATVFGVSAQEAFGVTPGQELFGDLRATVDAMKSGDVAGMRAGLDAVDAAMQRLSVSRTSLGAQMNTLDLADQGNQSYNLNLNQAISAARDVDPAQAYSRLIADRYSQEATYSVLGSASKLSLIKYL